MKVIIIPSWYHTPNQPNIGSPFREQTKMLINKGIEAAVIFADLNMRNIQGKPSVAVQKSFEMDDGIPTFRLDGVYLPKILPGVMKRWTQRYIGLYDSYHNKFGKPDLLHGRSYLGGYVAKKISDKYEIPYVITEHSSNIIEKKVKIWQVPYVSEAYEYASGIGAVSNGLANGMKRYTTNDIEVIPNFVDTKVFYPPTTPKNNERFTYLSIGGLELVKGHDVLIKSFKLVKDQLGDRVQLLIGGSGTQDTNLKRLIIALGLSDQVKMLGQLSRTQVPDKMRQADAFVLASRFETFGNVIIEAMSSGLPVIATDSAGPKDILTKETGILASLNNHQHIANAMVEVFHEFNMGTKGKFQTDTIRNHAVDHYSHEVVVDQMVDFYKRNS